MQNSDQLTGAELEFIVHGRLEVKLNAMNIAWRRTTRRHPSTFWTAFSPLGLLIALPSCTGHHSSAGSASSASNCTNASTGSRGRSIVGRGRRNSDIWRLRRRLGLVAKRIDRRVVERVGGITVTSSASFPGASSRVVAGQRATSTGGCHASRLVHHVQKIALADSLLGGSKIRDELRDWTKAETGSRRIRFLRSNTHRLSALRFHRHGCTQTPDLLIVHVARFLVVFLLFPVEPKGTSSKEGDDQDDADGQTDLAA
jgi:hypothetical protein